MMIVSTLVSALGFIILRKMYTSMKEVIYPYQTVALMNLIFASLTVIMSLLYTFGLVSFDKMVELQPALTGFCLQEIIQSLSTPYIQFERLLEYLLFGFVSLTFKFYPLLSCIVYSTQIVNVTENVHRIYRPYGLKPPVNWNLFNKVTLGLMLLLFNVISSIKYDILFVIQFIAINGWMISLLMKN